ncbi:hypothetical protein, partial [Bifidobacterium aquikefiri]|uniref:hypothetical protein n=1 Tax=Bifidobacterium aquikefiri TaxID=1653207 RepID=UPI0023F0C1AB
MQLRIYIVHVVYLTDNNIILVDGGINAEEHRFGIRKIEREKQTHHKDPRFAYSLSLVLWLCVGVVEPWGAVLEPRVLYR